MLIYGLGIFYVARAEAARLLIVKYNFVLAKLEVK